MKTNKKISFLLAIVMIFTSLIAPFSDVLKAEGGGGNPTGPQTPTSKVSITVKGDQRVTVNPGKASIKVDKGTTWATVKSQAEDAVGVGNGCEKTWLVNDANGAKLSDDYAFNEDTTVYLKTTKIVNPGNQYMDKKNGISYVTEGPQYPGDVQVYRDVYPVEGEEGSYQVTLRAEAMNYPPESNDLIVLMPYARTINVHYNTVSHQVLINLIKGNIDKLREKGFRDLRYALAYSNPTKKYYSDTYYIDEKNPELSNEYHLDKNLSFDELLKGTSDWEGPGGIARVLQYDDANQGVKEAVEILKRNPKSNKHILLIGTPDQDVSVDTSGIRVHHVEFSESGSSTKDDKIKVDGFYAVSPKSYYGDGSYVDGVYYGTVGKFLSYVALESMINTFFERLPNYLWTNAREQDNPLFAANSPIISDTVNAGYRIVPGSAEITTEGLTSYDDQYKPVIDAKTNSVTWKIGDTAKLTKRMGPEAGGDDRATYSAELTYKIIRSPNQNTPAKDLDVSVYKKGKFDFNYIPNVDNPKSAEARVKYFPNKSVNLYGNKIVTEFGYYDSKGKWHKYEEKVENNLVDYELKNQGGTENLIKKKIMMNDEYVIQEPMSAKSLVFTQKLSDEQKKNFEKADLKIQFEGEDKVPLEEGKPFDARRDASGAFKGFTIYVRNELKKDGQLTVKTQIGGKDIQSVTNPNKQGIDKFVVEVVGKAFGTDVEIYKKVLNFPDIAGNYETVLKDLPLGDYTVTETNIADTSYRNPPEFIDSDSIGDGKVRLGGDNKVASVTINNQFETIGNDIEAAIRIDSVLEGKDFPTVDELKNNDQFKNILGLYRDNVLQKNLNVKFEQAAAKTNLYKYTWDKNELPKEHGDPRVPYKYEVKALENKIHAVIINDRCFKIEKKLDNSYVLNELNNIREVDVEVDYLKEIETDEIPEISVDLYRKNASEAQMKVSKTPLKIEKNAEGKYTGKFTEQFIYDKNGDKYQYSVKVIGEKDEVISHPTVKYEGKPLNFYVYYNKMEPETETIKVTVYPFGMLDIREDFGTNPKKEFKGKLYLYSGDERTNDYNPNKNIDRLFSTIPVVLNADNSYHTLIKNIPLTTKGSRSYKYTNYFLVKDPEADEKDIVNYRTLRYNASTKYAKDDRTGEYVPYLAEDVNIYTPHSEPERTTVKDHITITRTAKPKDDLVAKVIYEKLEKDFPDDTKNPKIKLLRDGSALNIKPEIKGEQSTDGKTKTYTYTWKDLYLVDNRGTKYNYTFEATDKPNKYSVVKFNNILYRSSGIKNGVLNFKELNMKQDLKVEIKFNKDIADDDKFDIGFDLFKANAEHTIEKIGEKTVSKQTDGTYSYTFKSLDARNDEGLEYNYSFKAKGDVEGTLISKGKSYYIDYSAPSSNGYIYADVYPYGTITIDKKIDGNPLDANDSKEFEVLLTAWQEYTRGYRSSDKKLTEEKIKLNKKNNFSVTLNNLPYYYSENNNNRNKLYYKVEEVLPEDSEYIASYQDNDASVLSKGYNDATYNDGYFLFRPDLTKATVTINNKTKGKLNKATTVKFVLLDGRTLPKMTPKSDLLYLKRDNKEYTKFEPSVTENTSENTYIFKWENLYRISDSSSDHSYEINAKYNLSPDYDGGVKYIANIDNRQFMITWDKDRLNFIYKEIPTHKDVSSKLVYDPHIKVKPEMKINLSRKSDKKALEEVKAYKAQEELAGGELGLLFKDMPIRDEQGYPYTYSSKLEGEDNGYVKIGKDTFHIRYDDVSTTKDPITRVYPLGTLHIKKKIDGADPKSGNFSINIKGPGIDQNITLSEANAYEYAWKNLPYGTYTVSQIEDKDSNYKVSINGNGKNTISVTLSYQNLLEELEINSLSKPSGDISAKNIYEMTSGAAMPDDTNDPRLTIYEGTRPVNIKPEVKKDTARDDAYIYTWKNLPLSLNGKVINYTIKPKDLNKSNITKIGDLYFRARSLGGNEFAHRELGANYDVIGNLLIAKEITNKPQKVTLELWRNRKGNAERVRDAILTLSNLGETNQADFGEQAVRDADGDAFEYFVRIVGEAGGKYTADNGMTYAVTYDGLNATLAETGTLKINILVDGKNPNIDGTMTPEEIAEQDRFEYEVIGKYGYDGYSKWLHDKIIYSKKVVLPDENGNYSITLTDLPIPNRLTHYFVKPVHGNAAAFPYKEVFTNQRSYFYGPNNGIVLLTPSKKSEVVTVDNIRLKNVDVLANNRYEIKDTITPNYHNDRTEQRLRIYRNGIPITGADATPEIAPIEGVYGYSYSWRNLAAFDPSGKRYKYTVDFIKDPNNPNSIKLDGKYYNLRKVDANNFVHTEVGDMIELTSDLTFAANAPDKKPVVKLQLYRTVSGRTEKLDGAVSTVVYESGIYKAKFEDQARYDSKGNAYRYFVKVIGEDSASNTVTLEGISYRIVYNGMNLRLIPISTKTKYKLVVNFIDDSPTAPTTVNLIRYIDGGNKKTVSTQVFEFNDEKKSARKETDPFDDYDNDGNKYNYEVNVLGEKDGQAIIDTIKYRVTYERNGSIFIINNSTKLNSNRVKVEVKYYNEKRDQIGEAYTFYSDPNKIYTAKEFVEKSQIEGYLAKNPDQEYGVGTKNISFRVLLARDWSGISDVVPQKPDEKKPDVPPDYVKVEFKAGEHGTIPNDQTVIYWVNPNKEVNLEAPKVNCHADYVLTGWSSPLQARFEHNTNITAKYELSVTGPKDPTKPGGGNPDPNKFWTVTFKSEDKSKGTVDSANTFYVYKDADPKHTLADLKDKAPKATGIGDYTFKGWSPVLDKNTDINKDLDITAHFIKTKTTEDPANEDKDKYYTLTVVAQTHAELVNADKDKVYLLKEKGKTWTWNEVSTDAKALVQASANKYTNLKVTTDADGKNEVTNDFEVAGQTVYFHYSAGSKPVDPSQPDPSQGDNYIVTFIAGEHGSVDSANTVYVPKNKGIAFEDIAKAKVTPNSGYKFDKWTLENGAAINEKAPISSNLTVKANFVKDSGSGTGTGPVDPTKPGGKDPDPGNNYKVTFVAGANGKVAKENTVYVPKTPQKTFGAIDKSKIKVTPDDGYKFDKWSLKDNESIDGDKTVTAYFIKAKTTEEPTNEDKNKYDTLTVVAQTNAKLVNADKDKVYLFRQTGKNWTWSEVSKDAKALVKASDTKYTNLKVTTDAEGKNEVTNAYEVAGKKVYFHYSEEKGTDPTVIADPTGPVKKGYVRVIFNSGTHGTLTVGSEKNIAKKTYEVKSGTTLVNAYAEGFRIPSIVADQTHRVKNEFGGWDKQIANSFNIGVDYTYTAQYEEKGQDPVVTDDPHNPAYVKVEFDAGEGKLYGRTRYWVLIGHSLSELNGFAEPTAIRSGFKFTGWSPDFNKNEQLYANKTYTAQYEQGSAPGGQDIVPQLPGEHKPNVPSSFVKVEFDAGKHGIIPNGEITIYWVNPDVSVRVPEPTVIADRDYKFKGWDERLEQRFARNTFPTAEYKFMGDDDNKGGKDGNNNSQYQLDLNKLLEFMLKLQSGLYNNNNTNNNTNNNNNNNGYGFNGYNPYNPYMYSQYYNYNPNFNGNIVFKKYIDGYTNGTFMPNKGLSRAEAAQILANVLAEQGFTSYGTLTRYTDVNGSEWYANAISIVTQAGVFCGLPDGRFAPNREITKAEWISVLTRYRKLGQRYGNSMNLPMGHWAISQVEAAHQAGWLGIYTSGLERLYPDSVITRKEVVAITNKAFNIPVDIQYLTANLPTLKNFMDVSPNQWYFFDVIVAANTFYFDSSSNRIVNHIRADGQLANSAYNVAQYIANPYGMYFMPGTR